MNKINFGELRIGETARKHIQDCLDTNWISIGPKTQLLEEQFAKLMDCKYGVATSSGTSSLVAMTLALPEIAKRPVIRGKSKVICPALGFIANSTSIVSGGLIPKWVDIRPEDLNIDDSLIEQAIDDDVVAIYTIGTMGCCANMPAIKEIADKYDLMLFDDACESYGSSIDDTLSHKYAIGGCSSMYIAHLVQAGEFSVVFTDDEELQDVLRSIRSHGRHPNSDYFDHVRFGSNFKPTDLCASIGLEGVEQFHENIVKRKAVWWELVNHVYDRGYNKFAWFSNQPHGKNVMPHGFSITLKPTGRESTDRDIKGLMDIFDKNRIQHKRNFGFCGSHGALKEFVDLKDDWDSSAATWCGNNGIHIGCHRYIDNENVRRIKGCLDSFFGTIKAI